MEGWLNKEQWKVFEPLKCYPHDRVQNPNEQASLVYEDEDEDATGLGSMAWPRR